jgi:HAD superfamily hydrolase (TIGR01549 family)
MDPVALFDLDNTLVDREAAFRRWAVAFVDDRGLGDAAFEYLMEVDGGGFATREVVFDGVRESYGLAESTEALIAEYRATHLDFFEPDPTVRTVLGDLGAAGWRLGVVTNGPPSQRGKLERAGLLDLFDALCISDEVGVAKPDRRIFEEALRRSRGSDEAGGTVWMVGDTAAPDIAGGRGAGFRTVWMHRGRRWAEAGYRPDHEAASIPEAVEYLVADRAG